MMHSFSMYPDSSRSLTLSWSSEYFWFANKATCALRGWRCRRGRRICVCFNCTGVAKRVRVTAWSADSSLDISGLIPELLQPRRMAWCSDASVERRNGYPDSQVSNSSTSTPTLWTVTWVLFIGNRQRLRVVPCALDVLPWVSLDVLVCLTSLPESFYLSTGSRSALWFRNSSRGFSIDRFHTIYQPASLLLRFDAVAFAWCETHSRIVDTAQVPARSLVMIFVSA
jgi:hypothetical protein